MVEKKMQLCTKKKKEKSHQKSRWVFMFKNGIKEILFNAIDFL